MAPASQSVSAGMPLSSYTPPLARSDTDTRPITSMACLFVVRLIIVFRLAVFLAGSRLVLLGQVLENLENLAVGLGRLVLGLLLAGIANQGAQVLAIEFGMLGQQHGQRLVVGQQFFAAP